MSITARIAKIVTVFFIVITSIFIFPACSKELTAVQVADKASEAMQNIKNYSLTETTALTTAGGTQDNPDMIINSTGSGIIDQTNTAFEMNTNTTSSINPGNQLVSMYLADNMIYENVVDPNSQLGWTNRTADSDDWKQITFVDVKNIQGLLTGAQVNLLSQETIGGVPCYVLDVSADPKKLFNMMSQPGAVTQDADSVTYWDNIQKDVSAKIWIARDTFNLTKIDYRMSFTISPQDLGEPEGSPDFIYTMQVSTLFSDINKSGPIVVPPEAKTVVAAAMTCSSPPATTIDPDKTYTATINTNYGDIVNRLLPKNAPLAVNNVTQKGPAKGVLHTDLF